MTWMTVCSTEVDWSATGAWFSGFATLGGVIVACRALRTWKEQIRLQDRFQKADALLQSFILCIRAGHDWQWDCGVGDSRVINDSSEKSLLWRNALLDYRAAWTLAHVLYVEKECEKLSIYPDSIQSNVISAGNHLYQREEIQEFLSEAQLLMENGVKEIIELRMRHA